MSYSELYRKQVSLLVKTLPCVDQEQCFALKGGTAINLFVRDLPRLSVDIDLTYLPIDSRAQSLLGIENALLRIANTISESNKQVHITRSAPRSQKEITKLVIRTKDRVQIKIEVTPVLRGCVYEPKRLAVCQTVEEEYGYAEIKVLSFADLYAGKIMAALDRQHPRDLFDVYHLFKNEGITEELRTAVIVYLISHDHSPHSLLAPAMRDISQDFEQNFVGMSGSDVSLNTLCATRDKLIGEVAGNMPDHHKAFLRSFYNRSPDWALLGLDHVRDLPAVKWREMNLDRSGAGTCEALLRKLEAAMIPKI